MAPTVLGFPPKGPGKLRTFLSNESENPGTLILYESPHRVAKLLSAAAEVLGADRIAAVCRELTKIHEQILRGTLSDLDARHSGAADGDKAPTATIKGEFVVLIGPAGAHWPGAEAGA